MGERERDREIGRLKEREKERERETEIFSERDYQVYVCKRKKDT